jgi:pimeloyl-ACP methyl ester carboxylesterase
MQQQIGFCTTADGARIAYATVGSGPALVVCQHAPSHIGLEWEEPRVRAFWKAIGRNHLVIRYDKQGCGLSDRNRTDFSLDSEVRTIEAIVKELGLESFVLLGEHASGAVPAIAYVVKSPDRVSHLILCNAQARWHGSLAASWGGASQEAFHSLLLSNSRMASLAMAEIILGSAFDASALQWYLRNWREGVAPEVFDQLMVALVYRVDLRDLLQGQRANPGRPLPRQSGDPVRSGPRTGGGDSGRSVRATRG